MAKSNSILCAAISVILGAGWAAAQDDVLVKLYTEARQAEAAGDYATATKRYESIVKLRPDMAEAHANLGNLYYVQRRPENAAESFKKALRLKPGLAAPNLLLGVLSFNSRDFEGALLHLKRAETLDPANPLGPLYLGYTYFAQKKHQEAIAALEKVADRDPANQDAWYHLSKLHGQLSKVYFERLQKEHPASFHTFLARSHFFESGGRWEEAGEELTKALAAQPHDSLKERAAWIAKRAAGQALDPPQPDELAGSTRYLYAPPEARQVRAAYAAERARVDKWRKEGASPQSLYELADGYQSLSFLSSLWVLQTSPDSYRAHELRAESLEAGGKLDEAIAEYRSALSLNPELQTIHFAIGNLYWRRDMLEEALVELREELKVNPNDPQTNYEIGDSLLAQNKPEEAEKHFAAALKFAPEMLEGHLAMERIASARNDSANALLHLKKATEIAPSDPTPQYRLWTLYRKMGRTAEAQQARAAFEKLRSQTKK